MEIGIQRRVADTVDSLAIFNHVLTAIAAGIVRKTINRAADHVEK
jgi:hypothetical protein